MNALARWYPGDGVAIAGLEAFAMIAVVVALTWTAEKLLARRRAALSSALWLAALVGVLATPALTLLGRQLPWHVAVLPSETSPPSATAALDDAPAVAMGSEQANAAIPGAIRQARPIGASKPRAAVAQKSVLTPVIPHDPMPTSDSASVPLGVAEAIDTPESEPAAPPANVLHALATLGFVVWGLGSMYLAARLVHGWRRVRRLSGNLRPLDAGRWADALTAAARMLPCERLPEICVSPAARSPFVAGLLAPRVVLPEILLERGTPRQIREVIVHECAHVLRRDPWIRVLQRLATVLCWIHPLLHVLNRRLDHAREEVCDNHVLAHAEPPQYAETLLTVAQVCYPAPHLQGYLTMIPRHHSLERRVADLLEQRRDTATRLRLRHRVVLLTAFVGMLVVISSIGLQGATGAQDENSKAKSAVQTPAKQASPAAAADKPAPSGKVTGRVIHAADGRPLAGAEVRLIRRGDYSEKMRKTAATAQGEFTFDGVVAGNYRVLCFHGNLTSRTRMYQGDTVAVAADGMSKPVVLKMHEGISVRVKVLSQADAKPIAGARVRLIWTDADRDHLTDAKGEVELRALTPETWHVEAAAKDHAAQIRILNLSNEQPAAIEMKLPPGAALQGLVRDEHRRPLGGVGISVFRPNYEGGQLDYVTTDAEGHYRFDFLPVGQNLQLSLRKLEYSTETKDFHLDPAKKPAQLDVVVKQRPHGGSVQGVVFDRHSKPIAGAEISNHGMSSDEVRKTTTDAQGKYLLDNVYTGSVGHEFIVKAKGFAPQRVAFKPGAAKEPAVVAVLLEDGHRIKGRVVNEAGKPIADVSVYFAHGNSGGGIDFGGRTATDAQGRFAFDSLPAKTPFTFVARGYSEIPEMELPLDGDKEVVVTMKSQGVIKGRVVDAATGKPLSRYTVRITFSPDRQPDEPSAGLLSQRCDPGEGFASAKGEFVLKDLMAGMPLQVSVHAEGYRRHVTRRAVAQAAADATALEIRMTAEDPTKLVTLRGKLVNPRGEPVRGAELRLIVATERPAQRNAFPFNWNMIETGQVEQMDNVLQMQRLTTAADGSFVFQRVPGDAEIELAYWGKGIPDGRVDHLEKLSEKERAGLVIKTPMPARIVGTMDRKAFPEFSSILLSGADKFYRATVAADGKTFVIEDLPAGNFEIQVYGPSKRVEGQPNAVQNSVVGRRPVILEEGSNVNVPLDEADRVEERES